MEDTIAGPKYEKLNNSSGVVSTLSIDSVTNNYPSQDKRLRTKFSINDEIGTRDKSYTCELTQVSDSDDDNWFVPRSSKRRIASTIHTREKYQQMKDVESAKPTPAGEFCEIDLKSHPNANSSETTSNRNGWSKITSTLLHKKEQSKNKSNGEINDFIHSSDEESTDKQCSESYLPPFQMFGKIEDERENVPNKYKNACKAKKLSRNERQLPLNNYRGNAARQPNNILSENSSIMHRCTTSLVLGNQTKSIQLYTSTASSETVTSYNSISSNTNQYHCQPSRDILAPNETGLLPSFVEVPAHIREFSISQKQDAGFEDSDSSWIVQTSSRRLVR